MNEIYIIAEIGINHNGDIDTCKDLISVAKKAGCNAVKFQKRDIESVYTKEYLDSYRESPWGSTQRAQKQGLEFSVSEFKEIDEYCKHMKISWFTSCWDVKSQILMRQFNTEFNKIASTMIVDSAFLELVAAEGKHTFISTGMCTYEDIDKAVAIFNNAGCSYELMHTVSTYPMKDESANLRVIQSLKERYGCNVGYSGHEVGLAVSYAAAAFGISSLERHITLDRSMYGSDQSASIEPAALAQLVGAVRKIEAALGDGVKRFTDEEQTVALKLRQHLIKP